MSTDTTEKKNIVTAEPGSFEIRTERAFDAPRELVYRAFTDPELVTRWWGPDALSTVVETLEARAGGNWRFVHTDGDGTEYGFHGVFHQVTPGERIVQTFEFEGMPGHIALETLTLTEENGKTTVSGSSIYQSVQDRDGMVASGMEGGWSQSMDKLEALLGSL
ncbi:ATPase [Amycolatopsis antarctica]|uniref:ATPase n=1 Tax=Amycolatopsis antarctica TaxID=1854586 RepID=A0A263D966_9PSEU|nr:SRPBCC family protein [Amycolatopsis antarctica]OZM75020.1 ATPase [Amycolatopsis antarctica]